MKMPLAYVTAAWSADPVEATEQAVRYCRAVYEAGFSPICPTLYLHLFLNDAVPEEHKSSIDMSRDLLRRSRVLVVCGHAVTEAVKNDIAVAQRLKITATTLEGILTVKGAGPLLTLASLFDGIGVFPLAARRQGIVPLWASEIEKAPVSITKRHFPDMEHLGDITRLHGGEVPPVDIITFGSPCQNLSSAGRREGLGGAKSSLFFQAVRIIEEMRDATGGQFPTIVIWENVMGALLSGNRLDFRAVLQSLTSTEIPMPASGRWANAGMVRGGGRDVCWRLLDAQHWADPRLARRQRVFVVADFGGRRAGAVLFKPRRLFPAPAPCGDFGLPPPEAIEYLLLKQGGRYQSSTPFKATVCGGAAKAGDIGNFLGSFGKPTDPFPTLMAGGLTVFALWREGREAEGLITWLTPTEGERAMGLPDGWTAFGHDGRPVSARARQKALGNSIALPCAEYIMAGVKEELEGGKPYSDI